MAPNMSQTPDCTNLTWHWYWTTNPVGATNTRSKKKKTRFKNTRLSTIRLHHTHISNFTNKQIIWNTQFNERKTLHNGLALSKTMTNLTTHPADKPQHIRNNLEFSFFFSNIRDIRHTITNLPHQKGSNCFKKKNTRERESEGDGCTNMRPQPPRGQSRINYHRKKKREKGQKPGNWGSRNKNFFSTFRIFEWTRTQRIFFPLTEFFSLTSFLQHDWRQFNFGFSTHDENDIRYRSNHLG